MIEFLENGSLMIDRDIFVFLVGCCVGILIYTGLLLLTIQFSGRDKKNGRK